MNSPQVKTYRRVSWIWPLTSKIGNIFLQEVPVTPSPVHEDQETWSGLQAIVISPALFSKKKFHPKIFAFLKQIFASYKLNFQLSFCLMLQNLMFIFTFLLPVGLLKFLWNCIEEHFMKTNVQTGNLNNGHPLFGSLVHVHLISSFLFTFLALVKSFHLGLLFWPKSHMCVKSFHFGYSKWVPTYF